MNVYKCLLAIEEEKNNIDEINKKIKRLEKDIIDNKITAYCLARYGVDGDMKKFFENEKIDIFKIIGVELEDDDKIKVSFKSKCGKMIYYSFNLDEIDDFEIFDKLRAKFEPEYKDFEDN